MVSKDDLIAYLLHKMPEEARVAFGERWMNDAELYEQVRAAEAELLDGYVRDKLDFEQRSRVETYLLTSGRQRGKLAFAEALQLAVSTRAGRPRGWRIPVLASSAAALLLAGVTVWFVAQNLELRRELTRSQGMPKSGSTSVYAASLSPDVFRGTARENPVTIPSGAEVLRLELELQPGDENQSYVVTVSSGGQVLWREEPVHAERRGPGFIAAAWIPSNILRSGDYEVKLATPTAALAYYRFTIPR
jgi:hypothetical protein